MKITMHHVASHAGVVISTVSRVLNNHPNVSSKTKEKVLKSVEALGFVPDKTAQNLVHRRYAPLHGNKTRNIGCIVSSGIDKYSSPFIAGIIDGIDEEAIAHNHRLAFVYKVNELSGNYVLFNEMISDDKIDGLIIIATRLNGIYKQVSERIKPLLSLKATPDVDMDYILPDDFQAGYDAVKYLASLNHDRIAFMADLWPDTDDPRALLYNNSIEQRFAGYKQALADLSLKYDETIVAIKTVENKLNQIENGYSIMKKLIDKSNPPPSAVFCASDLITAGAVKALKDKEIAVPDDISVVTCGDSPESISYVEPALTAFGINKKELGKLSVSRLIERINNPEVPTTKTMVKYALTERASCKKVNF
ncbi:MAG: hypothetical protein A2297_10180 [Elusimicrobia bacterium RIFOXYB2_FULL_48_7]|nr:MAG: hypothetical protein A2297_10180 [Elusimicrobia bacterium RIFOXYB2_FULL_48_7]